MSGWATLSGAPKPKWRTSELPAMSSTLAGAGLPHLVNEASCQSALTGATAVAPQLALTPVGERSAWQVVQF